MLGCAGEEFIHFVVNSLGNMGEHVVGHKTNISWVLQQEAHGTGGHVDQVEWTGYLGLLWCLPHPVEQRDWQMFLTIVD